MTKKKRIKNMWTVSIQFENWGCILVSNCAKKAEALKDAENQVVELGKIITISAKKYV